MKSLNMNEIKAVSGGWVMLPVVAYVWYEYGGGKEFIESL